MKFEINKPRPEKKMATINVRNVKRKSSYEVICIFESEIITVKEIIYWIKTHIIDHRIIEESRIVSVIPIDKIYSLFSGLPLIFKRCNNGIKNAIKAQETYIIEANDWYR